jgi:long-chain acyl-CoA synthetase
MTAHHATALNLASIVEYQAMLTPDRPAVTCGAERLTCGELDALSSEIAAALVASGVNPGDRVALSCPNVLWFPLAYFGILKAGATVVPINVLLKPREIAYHLQDSSVEALIVFEGSATLPMAEMARAACEHVPGVKLIVITRDPVAPSPVPAFATLGGLMRAHTEGFEMRRRRPEDTAVILYTSGTTGHPKGAELTHENMLLNAIASRDILLSAFTATEQPVTLVTLPLFHSTAQTCQMNAGLYGGWRLVLLPRFDPQSVLDTMRAEKVGYWVGVPTMYWALLQHVTTTQLDVTAIAEHLRVCVSGGSPMPVEVLRQFEATFNVRVLEGYGLSETAPVVSFNHMARPSKPGTVGQPVFGVEVRCVDLEGVPLPAGQRGEIVVRGPSIMKGYHNRPEATAEVMRNGWFHTGDIGLLDEDGYLSVVDRKKDMILRGGFNVYPRELEEVLMTHPAISLAAVVGVPDERLGEEVKAFVVLKAGATLSKDELLAWCRTQFAAYKYPHVIEFRDSLPISATGKILKRQLTGT